MLLLTAGEVFAQARNLNVSPARQQPAQEQRVALVIGNGDYAESPLRNPVNDARAIAAELRQANFKVTLLENADMEKMYGAIRDFGDQLRGGGVGLFYFAGHGVQIGGRNYLIPVAAPIQRQDEVVYRSIDAGQVLQKMETAGNRVNIVILDACRNNPFARTFRSLPTGLAVMEAPVNTLVAFATAPGAVASDGPGKHGLYTEHLLKNFPIEGLRVEDLFKQVRAGVRKDSGGRQTPWENTSLETEFYFRPLPARPVAPANPFDDERYFWDSIKHSTSPADFEAFLRKFPSGQFHELARNRLDALFWDSIKYSSNPADFENYLRKYPSGQFIEPARNRLDVLRPALAPPPAPPVEPPPIALPVVPEPAKPEVAPSPAPSKPPPPLALQKPPASPPAKPPREPVKPLIGSEMAASALAVAPTGGYVVTGGRDGMLTILDVTMSKDLFRLMGHSGAIRAIAVSPDGRFIASGGEDATVRLWSSSATIELKRMRAEGVVTALAFSPNGRQILSGDRGGAVKLWNIDGTFITRYAGHAGAVRSVAFSREGRYVLSGGADNFARLWEIGGGAAPSQSFGPHKSAVVAVRMSADQVSLVSALTDGAMWSWDMTSGKGAAISAAAGTGVMVALGADGRNAFIARDDGAALLWDITARRELKRFSAPASAVTAVALDANLALVAADGQRLRLWSIRE